MKDVYESYRTGYTYYANGDLKQRRIFCNAAQLNGHERSPILVGRTLYDLGKLADAEDLRKVIEIDPLTVRQNASRKNYSRKTI